MIEEADFQMILRAMGVKQATAVSWAPVFYEECQPERFSSGMDDLIGFLPQILHECRMLEQLEEDLSYSAARIVAVWPSRFPTQLDAAPYARNPRALANKVYGGRMGNTAPDDGYIHRGRCPIMATGKDAYLLLSRLCGQDFDVLPDLLLQPRFGLEAAVHWWEDRVPDSMLSDQVRLRRRVNGGVIGMEHVAALHKKLTGVLA